MLRRTKKESRDRARVRRSPLEPGTPAPDFRLPGSTDVNPGADGVVRALESLKD